MAHDHKKKSTCIFWDGPDQEEKKRRSENLEMSQINKRDRNCDDDIVTERVNLMEKRLNVINNSIKSLKRQNKNQYEKIHRLEWKNRLNMKRMGEMMQLISKLFRELCALSKNGTDVDKKHPKITRKSTPNPVELPNINSTQKIWNIFAKKESISQTWNSCGDKNDGIPEGKLNVAQTLEISKVSTKKYSILNKKHGGHRVPNNVVIDDDYENLEFTNHIFVGHLPKKLTNKKAIRCFFDDNLGKGSATSISYRPGFGWAFVYFRNMKLLRKALTLNGRMFFGLQLDLYPIPKDRNKKFAVMIRGLGSRYRDRRAIKRLFQKFGEMFDIRNKLEHGICYVDFVSKKGMNDCISMSMNMVVENKILMIYKASGTPRGKLGYW